MAKSRQPPVREPVQVYLDPPDRTLLDELSERSGLSRAELLRRGLRRLAAEQLPDRSPGWSLDRIVGALGPATDLPDDLAARHDEYLYGPSQPDEPSARRHRRAPRAR